MTTNQHADRAATETYVDDRFSFLIDPRSTKPRESGITFIQADGPFYAVLNRHHLENLLEYGGAWIDWYKFTVGSCLVQPPHVVEEKLELLDEHLIQAFPGGNLIEEAVARDRTDELLSTLREVGFPRLEISSTAVPMEIEEKAALVETASDMGFNVHAEIGRKRSGDHAMLSLDDAIEEMNECLAAGADKVIFESDEFEEVFTSTRDEGANVERVLAAIDRSVGTEQVVFEVPLTQEMMVLDAVAWFINNVGPEVNLGNVNPNYLNKVEQMRRNIGPRV